MREKGIATNYIEKYLFCPAMINIWPSLVLLKYWVKLRNAIPINENPHYPKEIFSQFKHLLLRIVVKQDNYATNRVVFLKLA